MKQTENQDGNPPRERLCGFDVLEMVGMGAGSAIYAVSDPVDGDVYALKYVAVKSRNDLRYVEQLDREHEIGSRVTHPVLRRSITAKHKRSLLHGVTAAGLLMEFVPGVPLDHTVVPTIRAAVRCFRETARALSALHEMGFVHCDLKPSNILVGARGQTKVIDLGQACPIGTRKKRIQGTPDYIAPEQVRCEPVTERTDVYNFGATMYALLCGENLPTLFTIVRTTNSFLLDDQFPEPAARDSRIPLPLSHLVMDCLRSKPAKRPDMIEVKQRLDLIELAFARHAGERSSAFASGNIKVNPPAAPSGQGDRLRWSGSYGSA